MTRTPRPLGRTCGWCRAPLEATRRDAVYCGKRCRQAANRATVRRTSYEKAFQPMRLAYADPPYPGQAFMYRDHPDYAGEVDLDELLSRLEAFDGWALSTSARALPDVLARCVARGHTVRVGVWVRDERPHTGATRNEWEPVVFAGGRRVLGAWGRTQISDVLATGRPRPRPTLPTSVLGMKPPVFCAWVFEMLGAAPGDDLADLYPGSGIVTRSWRLFTGQPLGDPLPAATRDPSGVDHDGAPGCCRECDAVRAWGASGATIEAGSGARRPGRATGARHPGVGADPEWSRLDPHDPSAVDVD